MSMAPGLVPGSRLELGIWIAIQCLSVYARVYVLITTHVMYTFKFILVNSVRNPRRNPWNQIRIHHSLIKPRCITV